MTNNDNRPAWLVTGAPVIIYTDNYSSWYPNKLVAVSNIGRITAKFFYVDGIEGLFSIRTLRNTSDRKVESALNPAGWNINPSENILTDLINALNEIKENMS
jgi:hypothetical protein